MVGFLFLNWLPRGGFSMLRNIGLFLVGVGVSALVLVCLASVGVVVPHF